MIIIPNLFKDNLSLKAYSFKATELKIVNDFLTFRHFDYVRTIIEQDSYGRNGERFLISGNEQVIKFETVLKIRFKVLAGIEYDNSYDNNPFNNQEEEGNVDIDFENDETEDSYCCKRINDRPSVKNESEEITAIDYYTAVLKCAMLAKTKNWYAADTEIGKCSY